MRSIDELAPQEENDTSKELPENSSNELLEGLQSTVKQMTEGCNQIAETVGKILESHIDNSNTDDSNVDSNTDDSNNREE